MQSSSTLGASSFRPTSFSRLPSPRPAAKALVGKARQGTVWAATGQSGQSGGLSREEARAKQTGVTRGGSTTSSTGTPGGVQPSSYAASPASRAEDTSRTAATTPKTAAASAKQNTDAAANSAQSQVDSTAASAKSGIRQARAGTSRGASRLADQAEETADQLADQADRTTERLADQAEDTARAADRGADEAADQIEEGSEQLAQGVSQAGDQVADAVRQARDALKDAPPPEELVDQARDAVDDAIDSARNTVSAAFSPGPGAPMRGVPLTSFPADPFKASGTDISQSGRLKYFKYRLLASVAGLDRGFTATPEANSQVEDAVSYLVSAGEPVNLSWTVDEKKGRRSSLAQLNGLWRLVYSSNFAGGYGGLGGASSPFNLGQVYQSISTYASRLDNIVELYSKINVPQLPFLPPTEPITTTATLKHSFEPVGYGTVQLTFEDTEIKTTGGINNVLGNFPELTLPQLPEPLRPTREQRTSRFDNLYLDDEVRVSRGSRGELRVFVRT